MFTRWLALLEEVRKAREHDPGKKPEKDKVSKHEFSNRTGQAQKH